ASDILSLQLKYEHPTHLQDARSFSPPWFPEACQPPEESDLPGRGKYNRVPCPETHPRPYKLQTDSTDSRPQGPRIWNVTPLSQYQNSSKKRQNRPDPSSPARRTYARRHPFLHPLSGQWRKYCRQGSPDEGTPMPKRYKQLPKQ